MPSAYSGSRSKRAVDILIGSIGLLITALLFPIVGLIIKSTSRGSIIYTQTRLGFDDVPFKVYKFRTMVKDAESDGRAVWAQENDPRVTSVGRVLRNLYIDELPQWLNVIKGEMSVVGPRPERPELAAGVIEIYPRFKQRVAVKPGITGLAQIHRNYTHSMDDVFSKLALDLHYVRHASLYLDLSIVVLTFVSMIRRSGT